MDFPRVSSHELRDMLAAPGVQVIDTRPIDAYNGWRMAGEPRGGHIRSARALPFSWSRYIDWIEIVMAKEIMPENDLILYGYEPEQTEAVAALFAAAGYTNLRVYHDFAQDWSAGDAFPMDRLTRYTQLVSPQWLKQLISSGTAPEFEGNHVVVAHAHYQNQGDYDAGHIPGAVALDTNALESPPMWNRRPFEEVRDALQEIGITRDTTVVLYGRFSAPNNSDPFPGSSAGQLAAFRCALIMLWAGVKDVRILNGGVQTWLDAGFELSRESSRNPRAEHFRGDQPGAPELVVDLPEAKRMLASPHANLVCVRSWPEYIGEVSGYNYIAKKGRIPGAVFSECGTDAYHMEHFRNPDHTTREYAEIAGAWRRSGITPDKHNAFYCGTGWRGSVAFFNAWLMGWPRVSVYDGGWLEWSSDENNPVETGMPQDLAIKAPV